MPRELWGGAAREARDDSGTIVWPGRFGQGRNRGSCWTKVLYILSSPIRYIQTGTYSSAASSIAEADPVIASHGPRLTAVIEECAFKFSDWTKLWEKTTHCTVQETVHVL